MVSFNPYTQKYKVFGRTLPEKRAKRDGRNPATGAFSTGSHTGVVDLTHDIPMVTGRRNISLPDKTNYSKEENSPDNLIQTFDDKVTHVFIPDNVTPSNSTAVLVDSYENEIALDFYTKSGNNYIFTLGEKEVIFLEDNPLWLNFVKDDIAYVNGYARRTVNGGILLSGYSVEDSKQIFDIHFGKIFPEYNP